jgi:signal-transduction protein with cAMP-binding, CBS, and nucleotidyltransferase domain
VREPQCKAANLLDSRLTNVGPQTMEQIKPNHSGGAHFEARTVKDITEPAVSIFNKVCVKEALDEMQARAIDSSPVIDQRGELLGTVSKNKMNREVGGFGHDPKTEPVEAHIDKNNPYCFEDQTVAAAEQMMLNAKVGEVFVVTREKLLVGTINIESIAQEKRRKKRFMRWVLEPLKSRPESATIGCSRPLLHHE